MAKKQHIVVTGRAANDRINEAIPDFEKRLGMKRAQATAVAIRLESVGRLHSGGLISVSTALKGPQIAIQAAMASTLIRTRTQQRSGPAVAEDAEELRRMVQPSGRRRRR